MHEMSIAEGIIEIVERTAGRSGVTRVKEVRIEVGELAGVDIPSLEFAWVSVTRGGPAEGSRLVIERPRGEAWCLDCAQNRPACQIWRSLPRLRGLSSRCHGRH